ncbi:hypothetical protein QTG54_007619 [Skeletonema marinoi]|uniref:C2H2-type domain-containing protein n=1 Tax=Skeletonema marinoi TaxID=267567 RepID=A0AAD9DC32_9STRA|nr:hypothetical protein QTG54_007619 [Skeletonema marinoi]
MTETTSFLPPSFIIHCGACGEHVHHFDWGDTSNTQQYQYVQVTCPECNRGLYQCTLCQYNTIRLSNIKRHQMQSHKLEPQSYDTRISKPRDDNPAPSSPDMMDVDFSCTTNDSQDYETTNAALAEINTHDQPPDDDAGNHIYELDDNPISDEDIVHDEYLTSLITDAATNNDHEHAADDTASPTPTPMNVEYAASRASLAVTQFETMFPNDHSSQVYFWEAYRHSILRGESFGGIKGLLTRSTRQVFHSNEDILMSLDDAAIMFKIMDHALNCKGEQKENFLDIAVDLFGRIPTHTSLECFMSTLGPEQKESFNTFMNGLDEQQRKDYAKLLPSDDSITVPQNEKELTELLLKGKYAAFTNIASPKAKIYREHAVVSIAELLDHVVAHGVPIAWMQDGMGGSINHDINECEVAKEVLEEMRSKWDEPDKVAVCLVLFWSDGFQRSYIKQRDNNVWILTVTILNPHGNGTSPFHTYCIAIGKSSLDHTPIIEYFLKELETIKQEKNRFCGLTNKFIKTAFVPLLWSTDRPERASILHVQNVPSTYGLRSHVAAKANFDSLPHCDRCFSAMIDSIGVGDYPVFHDNLCTDCCRWDYFSNSAAAKTNPLPDKYPTFESSDSPNAPANRTTSETYLVSREQDFDWLSSGVLYSYHNAVSAEPGVRWRQNVMYPFLRSMAINDKVQELNWKSADERNKGAAEDNKPYIPYIWKSGVIQMHQFINSPMHLICHGVAADIIELVDKFLKTHRLGKKFESFANKYLLEIDRFKLCWCKIRYLPKTNWLAEDILGFSRIMPCMYGLFFVHIHDDIADTQKTTVSTILQMLHAFHVMLSALMNPRCSSDAAKIDCYIKLFLSCMHKSIMLITGSNEWWEKKGNFLSLLNLDVMTTSHKE